jgi:1-acyl-sn-glycerol-3-phosphate acyltransferase
MSGTGHPLARRSALLLGLFRLYLRYLFWRRFHAVRMARGCVPFAPAGQPLVVYCNHPSWWDPALLLLALPRLLPGRRGFGPMQADELRRYGLFRHMGLFGLSTSSASAARVFLRTAREGLQRPDSCLVVTAEGGFTDPRARPVRLRPGLAHLARRHPEAVFLPLALEYCFWNESKPEALLRFGPPVVVGADGGRASIGAWQAALQDGLAATMDALARDSAARNPAAFVELFRGTAGVGGIYDVWRRVRAIARGEAFDARHEPGQH